METIQLEISPRWLIWPAKSYTLIELNPGVIPDANLESGITPFPK
jgi:hypothetical protein